MLVYEGHLDPRYVLDEMGPAEMNALIEHLYYANKEPWEQARFIAYINAQVMGAKVKALDIVKFSWDEEAAREKHGVSNSEKRRLTNKINNFVNNGNRLSNQVHSR